MMGNLIDEVEAFLASGGEEDDMYVVLVGPPVVRRWLDGKPVEGVFTVEELRAAYPDDDALRDALRRWNITIDATQRGKNDDAART